MLRLFELNADVKRFDPGKILSMIEIKYIRLTDYGVKLSETDLKKIEVALKGGVFWILQTPQLLNKKEKDSPDHVRRFVRGIRCVDSKHIGNRAGHQKADIS